MRFNNNHSGVKRLVAYALILAMLLTLMPTSAFAARPASLFSRLFQGAYSQVAQKPAEAPVEEPVAEEPALEEAPAEEPAPEVTAETEEPAAEEPAEAEEPEVEEAPAAEPVEEAAAPAIAEELKVEDKLTVTIEAEEGAFPEGTEVKAEKADLKDVQKAVDEADDVDGKVLYAVDITFTKDGEELQPAEGKTVKVSFRADDLKDVAEDASIVHIDSETEKAEVVETVDAEEADEVAFEAEKFSIYAVVEPGNTGDDARMTLNFFAHPGDEVPIATVYVKNGDTPEELKTIIYDPGMGDLEPGQLFKGWTDKTSYTEEDADDAMNINEVRAWAAEKAITEFETVNLYPMVFQTYSVVFKDESGRAMHSEALIFVGDSTEYTINVPYTPEDQDEVFQGWYWDSPVENAVVAVDGSSAPFKNGTKVTISGDVVFSVYTPKGYWLIFNGNGKGASYTPPQFVRTKGDGEQGTPSDTITHRPADPTRNGYIFRGWYDNEACTGEQYDFGHPLSGTQKLYAKWEANLSAPYTIIIWKQRSTDDKNAADEDKNYDVWQVITNTGTVGQAITDAANVRQAGTAVNTGFTNPATAQNVSIGNTPYAEAGFHFDRMDQNVTIQPEGNSVLNIYYDRNLITITFNAGSYYSWGTRYRYIRNETTTPLSYTNQVTYSGLYDSELTFEWPSRYWTNTSGTGNGTALSWVIGSGANSGSGLTFYGSFKLPTKTEVSQTINYRDSGDATYRFFKQNADGSWPSTAAGAAVTISTAGGNFTFSEKFAGFSAQDYRTSDYTTANTGWTSVYNNNGSFRTVTVTNNGQLNVRFTRNKYHITYLDGRHVRGKDIGEQTIKHEATKEPLGQTEDIYYQADISSYGRGGANYYVPTSPTEPEDVFAGWYLDETCTREADFETMPEGGITVYAKFVEKQYRVLMHPNVPDNVGVTWGEQKLSFVAYYEDKIAGGNMVTGNRDDDAQMIGWYSDEALTKAFNFDAYILNDENTVPYDQTDPTELDDHGEPENGDRSNSDADNNRTWVQRKLDLWAKWREVIKDAPGVNVVYDAYDTVNDEDDDVDVIEGHFGTDATKRYYEDPLYYLDNAEANATAASVPDVSGRQFLHWVLQRWDEQQEKYVDTDTIVYPGDIFSVRVGDAKREDLENPTPNVKYKYTVQLRAEYGPVGVPTPTHITFFANNGTDQSRTDPNLQINQQVDILYPGYFENDEFPAYEGYKFLGWARINESEPGVPGYDPTDPDREELTAADLWLEYVEADHTFTLHDRDRQTGELIVDDETGDPVIKTGITQIAADERQPYHDLFAVWEKRDTFKVVYASDVTLGGSNDALTGTVSSGKIYEFYVDDFRAANDDSKPFLDVVYGMANAKTVGGQTGVLKNVYDNYLYGGYRLASEGEDGTLSIGAYGTVAGTQIIPEADAVYYVKDVDPNYLAPYYKYTYVKKDKLVTGLWSISVLDDLNYADAGFVVWNAWYEDGDNNTTWDIEEDVSYAFPIENAYKTLTVKSFHNKVDADGNVTTTVADSLTITPTDVYVNAGASSRLIYISIEDIFYDGDFEDIIRANRYKATFSAIPYWTTYDGINVLAKKYRTITIHPNTLVNTKASQYTLPHEGATFNLLMSAFDD